MLLSEMIDGFKKVNLKEALPGLLVEAGPELVQKVRNQLNTGTDATMNKITPKYADAYYGGAYTREKNQMNPLPGKGTPDLYLTGFLYQGLTLKAEGGTYDITSEVDYFTAPQIAQYGDEVFKVSDDNKSAFNQKTFGPLIMNYVENTVNGTD